MGNADNTSVKSNDGKSLAQKGASKNSFEINYSSDRYENQQIINARKAENLKIAKEKAKKKAKMAKASRKKNKK